jgi:hypothetical protein
MLDFYECQRLQSVSLKPACSINHPQGLLPQFLRRHSISFQEIADVFFRNQFLIGWIFKKLPLFPSSLGSGNLLCRMAITALLTSFKLGFVMLFLFVRNITVGSIDFMVSFC